MRILVIVSCLVAVALAQFPPAVPGLKEAQHFQAISQPHLPKDTNVLHATQQFLAKFAELKALADAAPDPVPAGAQQQAPFASQQFAAAAPHRFAHQQQAPVQPVHGPPPPHPAHSQFDVNSEIGALLARHHAANPTPAPAPAPRRAPVQQQAPRQHQQPASFPTFNVLNNLGGQQQQVARRPQFVEAVVEPVNLNIPTHNAEGLLINPKRHPGPLAHSVPAGITGRVEATQFTPEVAAAHRALANAHANILQQQASLPRPQ